MNCIRQRTLLGAAATALLMTFTAGAQAEGLSRDQVRAELAEARAQGLLDRAGEIGASADVLQARELANETQTRVLIAKAELEAQAGPELAVYAEQGRFGPVLVEVITEEDGTIAVADGPLAASVTAQWVAIDFD